MWTPCARNVAAAGFGDDVGDSPEIARAIIADYRSNG